MKQISNKRCLTTLTLLAAVTLVCLTAGARVRQMSDEDLVQRSELIVRATIMQVTSDWNEGHDQIYTTVRMRVDSLLKGSLTGGSLTLRVLGGTVGDTTLLIVDAPGYTEGEDVLLFLASTYLSPFPTVGMSQGKLSIVTDPVSGRKMVEGKGVPLQDYLGSIKQAMEQSEGGRR